MIAEDGVAVDLIDGVARVVGKVDCGYVFVDGTSVGDITEADLKDRRILGEEGFISVIVVVDSVSGKVSAGPEIHARGNAWTSRPSTRSASRSWMRSTGSSPRAPPTPTRCSRPYDVRSAAGSPTPTAGAR